MEPTYYSHPAGKVWVLPQGDDAIILKGTLDRQFRNVVVEVLAPAPAHRCLSFSGSGLVWPSEEAAYDATPNHHYVQCTDGEFSVRLASPGAMQTAAGTVYVPPHIRITVHDRERRIPGVVFLEDTIPFRRTTQHPHRTSPLFYAGNAVLPMRDADETQRARAYPATGTALWKHEVSDFWGRGPRV